VRGVWESPIDLEKEDQIFRQAFRARESVSLSANKSHGDCILCDVLLMYAHSSYDHGLQGNVGELLNDQIQDPLFVVAWLACSGSALGLSSPYFKNSIFADLDVWNRVASHQRRRESVD
jgi:hypothetical protein